MINPYRMKGETEIEHQNRVLLEENKMLRDELRTLRFKSAVSIPEPVDFAGSTWVIPLRFGQPRPITEADNSTHDDVSCYRLYLSKEWSDRGMFWRAEPFATDPRSHKKSRR